MTHSAFVKRVGGVRQYSRRFFSLDEAMQMIGASWVGEPHITYDPAVDYQYRIIRRQSSDGTLTHFYWLLLEALKNLFERTSYYKPMGERVRGQDVRYIIGRIRHAEVFGRVKLACSETHLYPGKRESITIPVRCEYAPVAEAVAEAMRKRSE